MGVLDVVGYWLEKAEWRIRRRYWVWRHHVDVSSHAFIHKTAVLRISKGGVLRIADEVEIMEGVILEPYAGSILLEKGVYVGPYSVLHGHGGLSVGRDVLIGPHVVMIPADHQFSDRAVPIRSQPVTAKGIVIGDDVWIGSGARILDGVHIGRGSVIGAGAVVTNSIPEYSVAVGVPSRVVRKRQ